MAVIGREKRAQPTKRSQIFLAEGNRKSIAEVPIVSRTDIAEAEASRIPANGLAPIVWQVGHLALADGWFASGGGTTVALPERYPSLFQSGTGGPAEYPPLGQVMEAFDLSQDALARIAATADLGAPVTLLPQRFKTIGEMLIFACTHRGYHAGKATTLRTLLGKPKLKE